ncbi:MAG: DMT family transporter [Clostridiales bacterium]
MTIKINPQIEIILASICWSTSGFFIKYINLPSTSISFFRLIIPTVFLFLFFIKDKSKILKTTNKIMLFASLLNAIRMFFFVFSYSYTSIGIAVIILYTWPIFALIFSRILLKEQIPKKNYLFIAIAFLGIILIYSKNNFSLENKDFLGISSMLLSSIIYSLTFIIFKKNSNNYSQYETVFYQNLVGSFIFLPFIFINQPLPNVENIALVLLYATIVGIIGFSLFFSALKKVKATTASFLAYFEVLSAILIGIIFLNEKLTWNIIFGGLLIIISTIKIKK